MDLLSTARVCRGELEIYTRQRWRTVTIRKDTEFGKDAFCIIETYLGWKWRERKSSEEA